MTFTTSLLALALAASPQAQDASDTQETTPETATTAEVEIDGEDAESVAEADESRIICRRTRIVGSRFNRRICGTAEDWARMRGESTETTRERQRRGRGLDPNRS